MGGAVRRFDLPPIAVCQSAYLLLTHRHREQAPSHIEFHFFREIGGYFLAMITARIGAGSPSIVLL